MGLVDLFYLMAIFTCLTVVIVSLYIAYQVYLAKKFITEKVAAVANIGNKVIAARYSTQYVLAKFLLNLLGEGGDRDE